MQQDLVQLQPYDEHNQELQRQVHPTDWKNPTPQAPYHLVVIGAGTAGLVTAAGAAGLGARVALVERELMGGDCLNVGCVPSKGIIAAARAAAQCSDAKSAGLTVEGGTQVDFSSAMERMRRLRAQISPADSANRFQGLGVDVYFGQGTFQGDKTVAVTKQNGESTLLDFKKAVIATGARAAAPPIPGLDSVDYLTNESFFSLTSLPPRLGVIGGGPIGCEMAQSFARLGSQVVLFERASRILSREDADASELLAKQLRHDGVEVLTDVAGLQVRESNTGPITLEATQLQEPLQRNVDQLLVAVGRAPNTDGLSLDAIGVKHDRHGVLVNDFMQTTNPSVFAAGDICSKFKFTHAADFQARIVIQNALFALGPFGKKKASRLIIPWATYTSPEVAHVGVYEADSEVELETYFQDLADVDRAILEGHQGFVKIHTQKGSDKILGATVVAENAGDMISEITLAMNNGIGLSKIASTIHPYPTQADAIRKLGDQFNRTKLTPSSQRILNFLRKLNVGK